MIEPDVGVLDAADGKSAVVELADGNLLAAWFGGMHEGHPDVAIWLARFDGQRWWSGSQGALLPPSPLRTVRATFTAHGSSTGKPCFTRAG